MANPNLEASAEYLERKVRAGRSEHEHGTGLHREEAARSFLALSLVLLLLQGLLTYGGRPAPCRLGDRLTFVRGSPSNTAPWHAPL